jgi:DNA-binding NarL/FixJ family response regulator
MDIVIAATDAAGRERLRRCMAEAALIPRARVDSVGELASALEGGPPALLVTGVAWPACAALLEAGVAHGAPAVLMLEPLTRGFDHPAFARGAAAVLPVGIRASALRRALDAAAGGLIIATPRPAATGIGVTHRRALSARERAVLELTLAGLPNKEIARRLALSPNTIKHHLAAIFRKLGVGNRAEAIGEAMRRGELAL